jgi:hypothetical protein
MVLLWMLYWSMFELPGNLISFNDVISSAGTIYSITELIIPSMDKICIIWQCLKENSFIRLLFKCFMLIHKKLLVDFKQISFWTELSGVEKKIKDCMTVILYFRQIKCFKLQNAFTKTTHTSSWQSRISFKNKLREKVETHYELWWFTDLASQKAQLI